MEGDRANGPDPVPPCAQSLSCDPWQLSVCFIGGQKFGADREIGYEGVVGTGSESLPPAAEAGFGCAPPPVGMVSFLK